MNKPEAEERLKKMKDRWKKHEYPCYARLAEVLALVDDLIKTSIEHH